MSSFSTPAAATFALSKEQAHAIVEKHITTQVKPVVWQVTEMDSIGYRYVLRSGVRIFVNFSYHFLATPPAPGHMSSISPLRSTVLLLLLVLLS